MSNNSRCYSFRLRSRKLKLASAIAMVILRLTVYLLQVWSLIQGL